MQFRNQQAESDADINLTPLIDVVFLLLIFFMVTTTFSREAQIRLQLPAAESSEELPEEDRSITIQISDIGRYAVWGPKDEEPRELINAARETLEKAIARSAGKLKDPIIIIRADQMATHNSVVQAMDAARALGFFQVTFTTEAVR